MVKPFIVSSLKTLVSLGVETDTCYSLGTGKNYRYLLELNEELKLFGKIVPLEHPRYIMQYKLKRKDEYIKKYLEHLII